MKLKCLILAAAMVASACCGAAEARIVNERVNAKQGCMTEWTPFALTLCGPVGLPWGDWDVKGLQIGIVNSVYQFTGLQIGAINIADRAYGLQIGVINVISTDDCAFLPIVNWSF